MFSQIPQTHKNFPKKSEGLGIRYIGEGVAWIKPYSTKANLLNYFVSGRNFISSPELENCFKFSSARVPLSHISYLFSAYKNKVLSSLDLKVWLVYVEMKKRRAFKKDKRAKFTVRELRRLMPSVVHGHGKISDAKLKASVARLKETGLIDWAPKQSREEFNDTVKLLGQKYGNRVVWVPRRVLKYLARAGTASEIIAALALYARRMPYRFFRARISCDLLSKLAGLSRSGSHKAIQGLVKKNIIRVSPHANKHWVQWHHGRSYEFASDLTVIPTTAKKRILRRPYYPRSPISSIPKKDYKAIALSKVLPKLPPPRIFLPPKKLVDAEKQLPHINVERVCVTHIGESHGVGSLVRSIPTARNADLEKEEPGNRLQGSEAEVMHELRCRAKAEMEGRVRKEAPVRKTAVEEYIGGIGSEYWGLSEEEILVRMREDAEKRKAKVKVRGETAEVRARQEQLSRQAEEARRLFEKEGVGEARPVEKVAYRGKAGPPEVELSEDQRRKGEERKALLLRQAEELRQKGWK